MKILVTDGNNRAALAITRSLGTKGYSMYVGEKSSISLAGASKYCFKKISYPDPREYPDNFIKSLINIIKENNIEIILPVAEVTTILITANRGKFGSNVNIPFASNKSIKVASDKSKVIEIANKLNIPTPKTICVNNFNDYIAYKDKLKYPLVIKPSRSRIYTEDGLISTSVTYADNRKELDCIIDSAKEQEFPILLQERISGPGIGVFVCYNQGKLIAQFGHKRLREKPPSGGVSTLRESVPLIDSALEYSQKILDHLDWHGVAMVEFKLDQRDKIPKIMEINGRFWGSLQLAIDAGVDFPNLLIRMTENQKIDPILNYNYGVKSRWLFGDLDTLLMVLFKHRNDLKLPVGSETRFKYLCNFLKFWEPNLHYEIESFSDPGPWWYEFKHWFGKRN